jgi:hypothetical protein
MRAFLIENGAVVQKAAPGKTAAQMGAGWVDGPDYVVCGYLYASGTFTAPELTVVDPRESMALSRAQFALVSAGAGLITEAEALAWAGGTSLPQFATDAIDAAPLTATEKLATKIDSLTAANVRRDAPVIALLGVGLGMTDEQIDTLFTSQ